MSNENEAAPHSRMIDTLARTARSENVEETKNEHWRDLWREVLPLERWFFVKDASEAVTPIYLKDGDNIILPVFTDVDRAMEYSVDFGGAERVYASAPGGLLSNAHAIEKAGVTLVVFNPKQEPFAVTPSTLKQLAEGFISSGEGHIVGVNAQPAAEHELDELAYRARKHVDDVNAKAQLWLTTMLLPHWFFVPVGEGMDTRPFAVKDDGGARVLAFSSPKRASEFAEMRALGKLDAVIQMTPEEAVNAFTMEGSAAVSIQFDPMHGSYYSSISQLEGMLEASKAIEAKQQSEGNNA